MNHKITLVLGAGSSIFMGYPTGDALRKELIKDRTKHLVSEIYESFTDRDMDAFIRAFRSSQMNSIDAFLARRPEFAGIGKVAIAALLLERESQQHLEENESEDHWYRYFFNKISTEAWENLNLSAVSVITFNYDRSFEHYMLGALMAAYNKRISDAEKKLKEMKIIHVYGSIGAIYPSEHDYFKYGSELNSRILDLAAARIRIIPEGRNDDVTLNEARNELHSATRIAFLGFGYDEINLARLETHKTCSIGVSTPKGTLIRSISGTCLGMTNAEKRKAIQLIFQSNAEVSNQSGSFLSVNCLSFIRESLLFN